MLQMFAHVSSDICQLNKKFPSPTSRKVDVDGVSVIRPLFLDLVASINMKEDELD